MPKPGENPRDVKPCKGGDTLLEPGPNNTATRVYKCLPKSPAVAPSKPAVVTASKPAVVTPAVSGVYEMTKPTLADLQRQYKQKLATYDAKVKTALATNDSSKLPEIKALNAEISSLLEKMLTEVTHVTSDTPVIQKQRADLVSTLNRIQRDYNGLANSTDSLELLRLIREGETGATRKEFMMYFAFFILACVGILLLLFFGGQNTLATSIRAATPARTAPFV